MKKKVAVLFGGRSAEHEVSLMSAKNVASALDKNKYDLILIGITQQGTWYQFQDTSVFDQVKALSDDKIPAGASPCALVCEKGRPELVNLATKAVSSLDVAFPVLHGTFGEDGCIQGLFKMTNLAFVGCGVLGSAVGMDKEVMKRILKVAGIPAARYEVLYSHEKPSYKKLATKLGSPFFIKPANAGSSVGVHKIKNEKDFKEKVADSFLYDHKLLAEEFIKGREIECSVLGLNHEPKASLPGEITPTHEFYSYEAKYLDENGASLKIPAALTKTQIKDIQKLACKTFTAMNCDGLTRVDFFFTGRGKIYVNEINTIPGFTKISMYPKMWEATGLGYTELITQLVELAVAKYDRDNQLKTSF
jgi:D-alanine-D-alanine ligase